MANQNRFPSIPQAILNQRPPDLTNFKCVYTYCGISMPEHLVPEREKSIAFYNKVQTYNIDKIHGIDIGVIYRILKSKKEKGQAKYAMIKILSPSAQKVMKIRLAKILKTANNELVNLKNPKALIGKALLIIHEKFKFFSFLESLEDIGQVEKIPKKGLQKITCGTINSADYHNIYCVDDKNAVYSMNIAVFFSYNKIDMQMDPNLFKDTIVKIYYFNKQAVFQILKTILKLDSNNPVFYLQNKSLNIYSTLPPEYGLSRIPIGSTILSKNLLPSLAEYYVSPPRLSDSISNVVSLFIFEHFLRFDRDACFRDHILNIMKNDKRKQAGFKEFSTSLLGPSANRNISELHASLDKYFTMKDVGKFFIENLKNDAETLPGLKEISDRISVVIELYDFTDAFYQVKFVPDVQMEKIPIMHLGKCSGCFFLMYNKMAMYNDGYLVEPGANTVVGNMKSAIGGAYYYHINSSFYGSQFIKFIKSLSNKVDGIKATIVAKSRGAALPTNNYGFEEEAFMIRDLAQDIGHKDLIDEANKFAMSKFDDSIFAISPAKFACKCGCNILFAENLKVTYPCGCVFAQEHVEFHINKGVYRCACGKSQLNKNQNYNQPSMRTYYYQG
ncbi:hypothetical protein SteCoe_34649 [Stentor coeruleus]|uniref:Uncharacterized protein n=1 Tax=Stentor coeruleus TaxID=5963 RepID=A0A1R2AUF2_9CILI|nr:hypothetical protein SteCoe_34649 [Stentor coeruleus]